MRHHRHLTRFPLHPHILPLLLAAAHSTSISCLFATLYLATSSRVQTIDQFECGMPLRERRRQTLSLDTLETQISINSVVVLGGGPAHRLRFTAAGLSTGHTGCVNCQCVAFSMLLFSTNLLSFMLCHAFLFTSSPHLLLRSHSISSSHPHPDRTPCPSTACTTTVITHHP